MMKMERVVFDSKGDVQKNVFGKPLLACSVDPMTGFFRNGCCDTDETDRGKHTVCVVVTKKFLDFSRSVGNDLSTPRPEFEFPGLKEGDRWCLCALRWLEAQGGGCAPQVVLESTNAATLDVVPFALLEQFSWRPFDA
jgi:uncharacterized protein (DUF2237 family)